MSGSLRRLRNRVKFYVLWPGLFVYFWHSHRTRVIVRCRGELLLIRDSTRYIYDDSSWTLPGGGVKRGEEEAVAAARELHEELGIVVEPDSLVELGQREISSLGLRYYANYYLMDIIRKPQLIIDSREVSGADWYALDTLDSLSQKPELVAGLELLSAKK